MPGESALGHPIPSNETAAGSFAVVALANALLDMSISVRDDYLIQKYGLPRDGQIEVTREQQALFSEVLENYPFEYVAGGSAQNTIRLVCRLINNRTASCVIGKIGRDPVGTILQHSLAQDGVVTRYALDEDAPSGCCAAMVRPDGTSCLAANIGAARGFTLGHLEQIGGHELIDRARIVYVEGFFASHSPDSAMAAIRRAHSRGNIVRLLSLSASYICTESHGILRQLLPHANLVVGNEDEFRALSGRLGLAETGSASAIARQLASLDYVAPGSGGGLRLSDYKQGAGACWDWSQLGERLVLMTRGSLGSVVATKCDAWEFDAEPVPRDQVRDTTGAGDAFLAGFLAQLVDNRPLDQCIAAAHRTASLVITQIGCRLPDVV